MISAVPPNSNKFKSPTLALTDSETVRFQSQAMISEIVSRKIEYTDMSEQSRRIKDFSTCRRGTQGVYVYDPTAKYHSRSLHLQATIDISPHTTTDVLTSRPSHVRSYSASTLRSPAPCLRFLHSCCFPAACALLLEKGRVRCSNVARSDAGYACQDP